MIPEGSEADSIFVANGLRSNFVSYSEEGDERLDGIQVHVLDVNRFRNFHYGASPASFSLSLSLIA